MYITKQVIHRDKKIDNDKHINLMLFKEKNMTAKFVKVSIFPLQPSAINGSVDFLSQDTKCKYYYTTSDAGFNLLELQALDSLADINTAVSRTHQTKQKLLPLLTSDVQSELLTLVDDPLNLDTPDLPDSDIIQLRHIEVLPGKYNNYRQWRDGTIFEVVRENKNIIRSFGAYHSLISTRPGVTFIAATDEQYLSQFDEAFTNKHYKDILVQAGNNYIIGGTQKGLNTKYYQSIKNLNVIDNGVKYVG